MMQYVRTININSLYSYSLIPLTQYDSFQKQDIFGMNNHKIYP